MLALFKSAPESVLSLVRLGLEHEMQHQELLVYDIKHLLCDQFQPNMKRPPKPRAKVEGMAEVEGGLFELGYKGSEFAWDNEKPAHQVFLQDFAIDRGLITNREYLDFIHDGGYQNFRWWFSEGWETCKVEQWQAPLYCALHEKTKRKQ